MPTSSVTELSPELVDVAARVPAWHGLSLEFSPLSGGITNRNYKVVAGEQAYVLRLNGADTHLLGIVRHTEHAAALAAASIDAGPAVLCFLEPEGFLITHFVDGQTVTRDDMRQPETIRQTAALLHRVHHLPAIPGAFSAFQVIHDYRRLAGLRAVRTIPDNVDWLFNCAHQIEQALPPIPACPCHNDVLGGNMLRESATGRLRLLDWEYAGMGDPYFDLGNLSAQHQFGPLEDRLLLHAYFGDAATPRLARLQLMKIMSDFREAMWATLQSAISTLEFDFPTYAAHYFARVSDGLADPHLDAWLSDVRTS